MGNELGLSRGEAVNDLHLSSDHRAVLAHMLLPTKLPERPTRTPKPKWVGSSSYTLMMEQALETRVVQSLPEVHTLVRDISSDAGAL
jgi:hypothetical protein